MYWKNNTNKYCLKPIYYTNQEYITDKNISIESHYIVQLTAYYNCDIKKINCYFTFEFF